jgi:hypothetical protein
MENNNPPLEIKRWDGKNFYFKGYADYQQHSSKRSKTAQRNRKWVQAPLYESPDGESFLLPYSHDGKPYTRTP